MPVNVNDVKEGVELLAAQDQKTIYVGDARFNTYAKIALDKVIAEQVKKFDGDLLSSEALRELKISTQILVPSSGAASKPSDYRYFGRMTVNTLLRNKRGEVKESISPVDLVASGELADRLGSEIDRPTREHPIVEITGDQFEFYPHNVGVVNLQYIKEPAAPVWNFTESSNEQVYNPSGSTDFELPEQFRDDLIFAICELLGMTVSKSDLIQVSQALNVKE